MSIYGMEVSGAGGLFIKLNDGDNIRVRFFGEPIHFQKAFKDQPPRDRFASLCLVANKETKAWEAKIFEFGWSIQKDLRTLVRDSDWGDPTGFDIAVSRTGAGPMDTRYNIVPKPKSKLNADQLAVIEGCDIDLVGICTKTGAPKPNDDGGYDPFADDGEDQS